MARQRNFEACGVRGTCLSEINAGTLDISDIRIDEITHDGLAHDLLHAATADDAVLLDVLKSSEVRDRVRELIEAEIRRVELW